MKKFAGFTPQQRFILLGKLGYGGPLNSVEMDKFLASSPNASAKLNQWAETAKNRVEQGRPKAFNTGGVVDAALAQMDVVKNPTNEDSVAEDLNKAQKKYANKYTDLVEDPTKANTRQLERAGVELDAAQKAQQTVGVPSSSEAVQTSVDDPSALVTPATVDDIVAKKGQFIKKDAGRQKLPPKVDTSTVKSPETAESAGATEANTYDATQTQDKVAETIEGLQAATAEPSEKATVRGQLEELMADFEGGGTPPWASGAMRKAMGVMQKRGMGASTMAGAAVVQAAMESAIGIASQDAKTIAEFEMRNLTNEQQTSLFKTQQTLSGMFSDQAADNAAKQFNAASQNQVDQFFAGLETTVSRFNAEQVNAVRMFNAGEKNTAKQFNASLKAQRDKFNATNDLIIAQANAKWRQDIATTNTKAQNDANMKYALEANGITQRALDQIWQRERDLMNFAFTASESTQERNLALLLAEKDIDAAQDLLDDKLSAERKNSKRAALGAIAGELVGDLDLGSFF